MLHCTSAGVHFTLLHEGTFIISYLERAIPVLLCSILWCFLFYLSIDPTKTTICFFVSDHPFCIRIVVHFSLSLSLSLSEIPAVCERKSDVPSVRASISSSYQKKSSFFLLTTHATTNDVCVTTTIIHLPGLYTIQIQKGFCCHFRRQALSLSLSIYLLFLVIHTRSGQKITTYCTTKTRKIK